jgi:cell division protein FtsL
LNEKKRDNRAALMVTVSLCVLLIVALGIAVFNYTSMLDAKDDVIAAKDFQITSKNSELEDLQTKIEDLQAMVDEQELEIENVTSQLAQANSTITSLNSKDWKNTIEIQRLNSQIELKEDTITRLNSEITTLENQRNAIASIEYNRNRAYQTIRNTLNQRIIHDEVSSFITPQDPQVIEIVYNITGGWSNPSDSSELWTDYKTLYMWVVANINYRGDGLTPILPIDPADNLDFGEDMWQFPNETLRIRKGDCEDQAILLCSMIRCYADLEAECIWITNSTTAHVGVQLPVSGDKLVILDPTGNYYSEDTFGNITSGDISTEIDKWLNYWITQGIGSDVYVYRIFSDFSDESFTSTSEYLTWMYS